jgi:PncC family amidohydrolase
MTLVTAESCTGGLLSHLITEVAGSSAYFRGGVVAYDDEVKQRILGVRHETLCAYGAVSEETACEMAQGARRELEGSIGLATTGIAGPGGGSPEKPVGLVFIALAAPSGTWCQRCLWHGTRSDNKAASALAALDMLRRYLHGDLSPSDCVDVPSL